MNPQIVFSKTTRGKHTIDKRIRGLDHGLRLALILVDGHSTVNQLKLKAISMDTLEKKLELLALNGLIQADDDLWQSVESNNVTPYQRSPSQVSAIKAKLIDAAILILGDDAHRVIKLLYESADDSDSLRNVIKRCKKIIELTIDEERAKEMYELCQRILN